MYNPAGTNTGRQWIEVQNVGTSTIDLGAKNVRVADAHGNHLIKAGIGSTQLDPNGVAIIATDPITFAQDFPDYSGPVLKSAFSLTSSGDVSIVEMNGKESTGLANVNYDSSMGGKDDGNSLQRTSVGVFVAGASTPGTVPAAPPAPLATAKKPSATKTSSTTRGATTHSTASALTKTTYDTGTFAPPAPAIAGAGGALSGALENLVASPWFSSFLLLLAFSAFSLILLVRYV